MMRAIMLMMAICGLAQLPVVQPVQPALRDQQAAAPEAAQPELVRLIEDEPAQRGPHKPNSMATRNVTLQNISGATLSLRVTGTSCPCTTVKLERNLLAPGASARVTLSTSVAEVGAPQWYNATIEAAENDQAGQVLRKQQVVVAIGYFPDVQWVTFPGVVNLCAAAGEHASFELFVRRLDRLPITLEKVIAPNDWVKVEKIAPFPDRPFEAVVHLSCISGEPGVFRSRLQGVVAGDPEPRTLADVNFRVEDRMIASPAVIIWRERGAEWGERSRSVLFSRNPVAVRSVVPARAVLRDHGDGFSVSPLVSNPDGTWRLTTSIDPGSLPSAGTSGTAQVRLVDDEGNQLCSLPLVWFRERALKDPIRE